MSDEPTIALEEDPAPEEVEAVHAGLRAFNHAHAGEPNHQRLHLLLRAPDGRVVGGCFGETAWGWLFVRTLWVAEEHRGGGHGKRLMEAAEAEARRRGCREAYLDTFGFQARPFYEALGYRVFGVLEGFPPGFDRFFLRKTLAVGPAAYG